jgi:hypothetical protein
VARVRDQWWRNRLVVFGENGKRLANVDTRVDEASELTQFIFEKVWRGIAARQPPWPRRFGKAGFMDRFGAPANRALLIEITVDALTIHYPRERRRFDRAAIDCVDIRMSGDPRHDTADSRMLGVRLVLSGGRGIAVVPPGVDHLDVAAAIRDWMELHDR